jgi:hypothetical protein
MFSRWQELVGGELLPFAFFVTNRKVTRVLF